ncbi:MAG: OPT/YSL family transporter [Proteobacteria bacterium]|nr:OPT/YSL family transporter [Cystobacterineae bacterium]MCL2315354.1 OPT/YSL family transporter [Pseudomonadota bacterium]
MATSHSEFNLRSVAVGLLVAALIGCAYPYIVLKIGFGPTISVVSAFLAFLFLQGIALLTGKTSNCREYNLVQTAGTASAQSAFMCVVLAAFDLLNSKPELGFHLSPTPLQVFIWMTLAGMLGVLLAVPLRKHFIDEENLPFPDGIAAGETLKILDEGSLQAKNKLRMLGVGGGLGVLSTWFRDGKPAWIPETLFFGSTLKSLNVGFAFSSLSFGSGLIIGLRVTSAMGIGALLGWFVLPFVLLRQGWIPSATFAETLKWTMWPATGLMVSGGITALLLHAPKLANTFRELSRAPLSACHEVPLSWVFVGSLGLASTLAVAQYFFFGVAFWESALAIGISVLLMLVGTRVLGETNWAPISVMANLVQALFALFSPHSIATNMVASGMSGSIAGGGEHLMQDYRAGKIVGANNRTLTFMQLLATPVGALAISIVYPLLRAQHGIGPNKFGLSQELLHSSGAGLTSPISVKWAGFAELLLGGIQLLPPYALHAFFLGALLGVSLTLLQKYTSNNLPSATSLALGFLIPAQYVLPMVLGGACQYVWKQLYPQQETALCVPLASGLIVGEALLALGIPVLYLLKLF